MSSSVVSAPQTVWSTRQVCVTAAVALLLGLACGYWLRPASSLRPVQAVSRPSPRAQAMTKTAEAEESDLLVALDRDPRNPALLAKVGYLYYATRRFPQAADYYRRSVEMKDNPVIRVELGRAYFYAGDADRALEQFELVAKVDPTNADALFNAGMIRWKSKVDAAGAIAEWQQLLRTHPDHPRRKVVERLMAEARLHELKPLPSPVTAQKP